LSETSKHCAFLTLDERGDYVIDDDHAIGPLQELGWDVSTLSWRQTALPWSHFDAVIIRSTWDYWNDAPSFLEVLTRIDRQTRLANSLDLVNWNLSKTYLRDLGNAGVGIVPTLWLDGLDGLSERDCADALGAEDLVVKPVIGANGQDAFRFSRNEESARWHRISKTFLGRACMVQRFMPKVLTEGEYSLFFFGGVFSHAILKVPAAGEFRSQEERGAAILAVEPEAGLLQRGQRALGSVPSVPLYARIDFVRNQAGDFDVMELELIEPSLYLRMHPAAPAHFARAIDSWFHADRPRGQPAP
jgi:glutathione synthase/RimK-type ligase-like ATP-grasp enzyme